MAEDTDYRRPAPEYRWHTDRTAPAVITVRTEFLYSEPLPHTPTDRPRHIFCYRSTVTDHSEFAATFADYNDTASTIGRMIRAFGDDADLEVIVRRKTPPPAPAPGNGTRHD
ncbi:MAG: hypothetical protein EKK51_09840 [Mycolicibacterium sp.]|uniref:hypothetical protein n=1 Tax=Mycobacteriaceae TaxID=1762 RepID=UPI000FA2335A|nr:hypothetical protein [Mycolicibacterium sp.]RUP32607.1 MAG: hypothetical protein EKK51_09840 [Mycolicibacterium sp.]